MSIRGRDRFVPPLELEGNYLGVIVNPDAVQGSVLEEEVVEFRSDDIPCCCIAVSHDDKIGV